MKCAGSQSEFFLTREDMKGTVKRIIAKANYQTTYIEGLLTRFCQYSVNEARLFLDNSSIISILYQAPHAPLALFNPVLQSAHPPFHGRRFPYESGAACVSRIIRTREEKPSRKGLSRGKGHACGVRTGGAVRGGGGVRHLDMQNMHMKNMDIPAGPRPGSVWSTKKGADPHGQAPSHNMKGLYLFICVPGSSRPSRRLWAAG